MYFNNLILSVTNVECGGLCTLSCLTMKERADLEVAQ